MERSQYPVRMRRLGDPEPPERLAGQGGALMDMVCDLTETLWSFLGTWPEGGTYSREARLSRHVVRIVRGGR